MKDLIDFKNQQIQSLQKRVSELEEHKIQLETWVYELCDDDTPKEYKDNVHNRIVNGDY